jgi:hypothetical protein
MIKLEQLIYELLPSEFIDTTPLGILDNTERTLISLHKFILSNFISLKLQTVSITLVNRPTLITNTDTLYIKDNTLYLDIKEAKKDYCKPRTEFYLPEFNTSQIGLEDIDIDRVRQIELNNFIWTKI